MNSTSAAATSTQAISPARTGWDVTQRGSSLFGPSSPVQRHPSRDAQAGTRDFGGWVARSSPESSFGSVRRRIATGHQVRGSITNHRGWSLWSSGGAKSQPALLEQLVLPSRLPCARHVVGAKWQEAWPRSDLGSCRTRSEPSPSPDNRGCRGCGTRRRVKARSGVVKQWLGRGPMPNHIGLGVAQNVPRGTKRQGLCRHPAQ